MRTTALALVLAVATALVIAVPVHAAGVYNINLSPVGDSGVSGTATTIAGEVSGATPYYNVEVNLRVDETPCANMVYEAWLVDKEADYKLSLGVFSGTRLSARQRLLNFGDTRMYDAIAVSLEPARDTNPAPATIVAAGNLPGTRVSASDFQRMAVLPEDEMFQRQVLMGRFALSEEQVVNLRMAGWGYPEISVAANVGSRCNKPAGEVAQMLQEGRSWNELAEMCNTTVAELLVPVPPAAVAGARIELPPEAVPPPGMVSPPVFYKKTASGMPIITQQRWEELRKRGYEWRDVAVAANISAETGEGVDDLLRMTRVQGRTWSSIIMARGVDPDEMMDVSGWPFSTNQEMMPAPAPPSY